MTHDQDLDLVRPQMRLGHAQHVLRLGHDEVDFAAVDAIRALADAGLPFFVANSFSKSMSVYGERCGALSVVCPTPREAELVVTDFRQYMPGDGEPVTQPTTAYLSYDDKNLYVA